MPKRLVFHTASLRGGGAERVFVLVANALASRGHAVTLFTWNADGPNAALLSPDVQLVSLDLPVRGERFGKLATLSGILRSAWFFRRLRPDAVFSAPEFANLTTALALLAAGSRVQHFPSFHAAASLPSQRLGARLAIALSRLVAARATKAIAVSAGVARDLEARGYPPAQVAVIHNPLPPPVIGVPLTQAWQAELAEMGEGPVIVTAGRLVPVKDHATLLRAFARLVKVRPARLVIFGEGPLELSLRAMAGNLGVGDRVLFPGYMADLGACYAAADLFVLSSTSEGFGNVLVEAMSAGVPVVSTDAPHGPREILVDGRYGLLVPVGDPLALADAMTETLDHPADPQLLRQRAADFAIDRIADRYEALL